MKRKSLLLTVLLFMGCFFMFTQSAPAFAAPEPDENNVVIREPTTDVDILYENYKNNSFELMTQDKPKESWSGVKEAMVNSSAMLKNFIWGGVKGLGQFNTEMVTFLFRMDVITPIKEPIQKLTSNIAGNMLSIAGTLGISFVTLIMGIKFIGEQRFRQALRVFLMTILIFTGLAVCKDATTANSLFNNMLDADKQIEAAFVRVNPVLGGESVPTTETTVDAQGQPIEQDLSANDRMKSAGELIASRIFYTNVYEPYLLMNYGTSNPEAIRKKTVTYKDTDYDRINLLLDNDVINDDNVTLHDDVTEYEANELNNRSIMYFKNIENTFYGCFYLVVNGIQTLVYFVLCFVRLVIAVMQIFLLPLLPILLLTGLFMTGMNVFANYFKAFGMTIFMKAMAGFACIFFATFLSLGFQLSNAVDNPWQKILTIPIYLLTPFGLYIFRTFLGSLFTGRVSLANALSFATNPFSTEKKMRDSFKEQKAATKEHRKQAKEDRKAALKKQQAETEKRGRQELGLKQKPVQEREAKRSALRRELQPKPQHKAPNAVEKTQRGLQGLHEKGQHQEAQANQQLARKRQRKAFDKANLKTAAALAVANQSLRHGEKEQATETPLRQLPRRTGQSSNRAQGQRSVRRQGQKQTPPAAETNQRQGTGTRSSARSQHRTSGQKPAKLSLTPNPTSQARLRSQGGTGGSPSRHSAPVRQKMQAVKQVIDHQIPPVDHGTETLTNHAVVPPLTRMAKRTAPPVKATKAPSGISVRRESTHPHVPKQTGQAKKGMRRTRARK